MKLLNFLILFAIVSVNGGWHKGGNRGHRGNRRNRRNREAGLWPRKGFNLEFQHNAPSIINPHTLHQNPKSKCQYESPGSVGFNGYVTIDNDNNGYCADRSGDLFKFNLDTCEEIWRINIAESLFGNSTSPLPTIISRQSPTLYDDFVLIGAPNARTIRFFNPSLTDNYGFEEPCFAIGYNKFTGKLEYKIDLSNAGDDLTTIQSSSCHTHGFIVDKDNKFAYGGMASIANAITFPNPVHAFQGKVFKIDLDTKEVVDIFLTFPNNNGKPDNSYRGASSWNFPSLIDNYLVFGTGNLYSYPDYIGDCLKNDDNQDSYCNVPNNTFPFNGCDEFKFKEKFFRCLEDNVFVSSIVTLDVNDFSVVSVKRTVGVDAWVLDCALVPGGTAPGPDCPDVPGPDADVNSIALYKEFGKYIAVTTTKGGLFFKFNIITGKTLIGKTVGVGGAFNTVWSSTIDVKSNTALSTYTGSEQGILELPNGDITCNTGTVNAIDLKTGKSKWIFVVPYGRIKSIDNNACEDPVNINYINRAAFASCTIDPRGNTNIDDSKAKIIIPTDINTDGILQNAINRAQILAPITISNDLVYIPIETGDIYVLKLDTGKVVKRLQCPSIDGNDIPGINAGVTVVKNRLVYYCGSANSVGGNIIISSKY